MSLWQFVLFCGSSTSHQTRCYRKNPQHLKQFYHPVVSDSTEKKRNEEQAQAASPAGVSPRNFQWRSDNSLLVLSSDDIKPSAIVYGFDMVTIIEISL